MKYLNIEFNIEDEKTKRKATFLMPSAEDALILADYLSGDDKATVNTGKLAMKYLVVEDNSGQKVQVNDLETFSSIFDNPFLSISVVKKFIEAVSPLIKSSMAL